MDQHSVLKFFSEANRVLDKGGRLIIGVPDAGNIIKEYFENDRKALNKIKKEWYSKRKISDRIDSGIDIVNLVIRDEDADEKYNPHFWGYDETKLNSLFKKFKFIKIKKWIFDKNLANPKREYGSIYLEGIKK